MGAAADSGGGTFQQVQRRKPPRRQRVPPPALPRHADVHLLASQQQRQKARAAKQPEPAAAAVEPREHARQLLVGGNYLSQGKKQRNRRQGAAQALRAEPEAPAPPLSGVPAPGAAPAQPARSVQAVWR